MTPPRARSRTRDGLVVGAVALVARLAVVAWAAARIPAAADGVYYDKIATRIAQGHGYTWLWPDGAVTYAAHYPVGYPALVALGYAMFGAHPVVAMLLNACLGAAAAVATWLLVERIGRRAALAAGLAVALHPALVPYTPAIMTEGPTAALLVIAGACADRKYRVATGLVLGVAILVRPQCLLFAPVLGALVLPERRVQNAAIVTALALAVCAPWTIRNCARMERCALVSVNGGWNLAIGTQTEDGAWREIVVPPECKEVFQEAAKDECFGAAARRSILAAPGRWIAHMPAKLHATFDYFGAAPWYLHTANSEEFSYDAKVRLATVETLVSRLLLAVALVGMARTQRTRATALVAAAGVVACFTLHAWPAYLLLGALAAARGVAPSKGPLLYPFSGAVILGTAATHAVFFGAGRYGLVVVPFVTALALAQPRLAPHAWLRRCRTGDRRFGTGNRLEREESPSSEERDAG